MRIRRKELKKFQDISNKIYSDQRFLLNENKVRDMRTLNKHGHFHTVYYPGPFADMAPVFLLDAEKYYYQDADYLTDFYKKTLKELNRKGLISELEETDNADPDEYCTRFDFLVENKPKQLHLFDTWDVDYGVVPQIEDADLIFACSGPLTEEMIEKAKGGSIILNLPNLGDNFWINEEHMERYGLQQIVLPTKGWLFEQAKLYRKSPKIRIL